MLNVLLAVAIVVWFALLFGVARYHLATSVPPQDARPVLPIVLVAAFAMLPLVFVVDREDGNAVLDQGLSGSNIVQLALTGLTGLYLVGLALLDRRVLLLPFSMPYLPFTLMIAVNGVSTLWSIVPSYTAYRTVELAVFTLATILIFDRRDIGRLLAPLLALFVAIWLVSVAPLIGASVAGGIVFSSAKNNMMPFVCAVLAFVVVFDRRLPWRSAHLALAAVGFVVAGSAASTAALTAIVPGRMVASPVRRVRILGWILALGVFAVFTVMMLGLSAFPGLLDLIAIILQKPPVELANATGRGEIWPYFIEATRDHMVGSGFSAADRFVQLLLTTTALSEEMGRDTIFITSSHNMYLSAWAGTGLIGIGFVLTGLGAALAWGSRLDRGGHAFVASSVFFLMLNGMTTPGIFQDWNVNVLGFLAVLAYARIGAMARGATFEGWAVPGHRGAFGVPDRGGGVRSGAETFPVEALRRGSTPALRTNRTSSPWR